MAVLLGGAVSLELDEARVEVTMLDALVAEEASEVEAEGKGPALCPAPIATDVSMVEPLRAALRYQGSSNRSGTALHEKRI